MSIHVPGTTKRDTPMQWVDDNGNRHWLDHNNREHVELDASNNLKLLIDLTEGN